MHAETSEIISQPAGIIYPLVRDKMDVLVPYIPNVDKIECIKSERTSDTILEVHNIWYAKAEIPAVVKSFVKPDLFKWNDYAVWKDEENCVDFRIESFVANKLYDLSGTNYFLPHGDDKTELKVTFDLEIHPERMPGVPRFLAKRAKPAIEEFIRKMLTPNLLSLAKGLNIYFAEHPPAKKKPVKKKAAAKKKKSTT